MKFNMKKLIKLCLFSVITVSTSVVMSMKSNSQEQVLVPIDWNIWKKMLLQNSLEALKLANSVRSQWIKKPLELCLRIKDCPFFLMDDTNFENSLYDRSFGKRTKFEGMVSSVLGDVVLSNNNEKIHYVGFASGLLFSDFVIIVSFLEKNSKANIKMSFLDPVYRDVQSTKLYDRLIKQFMTCISRMFPDAKLEILLIDNTELSPQAAAELLKEQPDIIVALAIPDFNYYLSFVLNVFKNYDNVPNFLLDCLDASKEARCIQIMQNQNGVVERIYPL